MSKLNFYVRTGPMTRLGARIWEQNRINTFGLGGKPGQSGTLFNKINSISPENWGQYGINPIK